jgi:hypothetical protein
VVFVAEERRKEERRRERIDWEDFGWDIVDKVFRALDYWCHNVSGDDLWECYSIHTDMSLYDLANEFADWSVSRITQRDLELLSKMPEKYYKKFDSYVRKRIEEVARRLYEEAKELAKELGEELE